ncbi:protein ytfJ [Salmonella enterica subsp. arizonae]|nr:protein ytfJ [Salmonella enterica subsp. arizonae]
MILRKILAMSCLLLPIMTSAHNLEVNQRVPPVGIADRGELMLNKDEFSYKTGIARSLQEKCASCCILPGERQQRRKTPR